MSSLHLSTRIYRWQDADSPLDARHPLSRLALDEAHNITRIYSVADALPPGEPLIRHRPFCAPRDASIAPNMPVDQLAV